MAEKRDLTEKDNTISHCREHCNGGFFCAVKAGESEASSEENKESRNPYDEKGFRLSYDMGILLDMFSSEGCRRNSP